MHSTSGTLSRSRRRDRRRAGVLSMELVLTLPILMLVLAGLFEFSLLLFARSEVVQASRVAARKATLPGVTVQDVEDEVLKVLHPRFHNSLQVDALLGQKSGDVVAVAVTVDMSAAAPDLLWPIGYSLQGRPLLSETCMIRE
ncbi:MAG TPA: TadE family protein [Planctomycetaceae bacterium]|nr:TadE family protein [Planctomycetaceae bacterium]